MKLKGEIAIMRDNAGEKLQILKHMGCNGVLITDAKGFVVEFDEEYFRSVFGLEKKDILNKSAYELDAKGTIKPILAIKVMETKEPVMTLSAVRGEFDVIGEAFPVFDEKGNIKEVISYTRDVAKEQRTCEKYKKIASDLHKNKCNQDDTSGINEDVVINEIKTKNSEFSRELKRLERIAKHEITILLTGGTGSGKTTLAKYIHSLSKLEGRFVSLNCGAIPENLFESELYGYEKGAFTGAERSGKTGLAETAKDGSLLLDEISELPMSQQVKLLDFLEEKRIRRVGGGKSINVNCRVIAATNKNLEEQVSKGMFREDLFFRLNVASFKIPDLRDRREDILPIAQEILSNLNRKYSTQFVFSKGVAESFLKYDWPGNIRELGNVIHSIILTADFDLIKEENLPLFLLDKHSSKNRTENEDNGFYIGENYESYKILMEKYESKIINDFYSKLGSSVKVAEALDIGQTTAARKIRKYVK